MGSMKCPRVNKSAKEKSRCAQRRNQGSEVLIQADRQKWTKCSGLLGGTKEGILPAKGVQNGEIRS